MNPKQKYLRIAILSIPLIIFTIATMQMAFKTQHNGVQTMKGYEAFLMGSTAILGGGLLEWFIWLANPLALWALLRFLSESDTTLKINPVTNTPLSKHKPRPASHWISTVATAIALSFSRWNEILVSESGTMGKILSFEPGYWLWVTSIVSLAIGINYYYYKYLKPVKHPKSIPTPL